MALAPTAHWHQQQASDEETARGMVILTQALPAIKPKPGHIIGRIVDGQRRPMTNVQLYIAGSVFGAGGPFEEVGELVTPNIDP